MTTVRLHGATVLYRVRVASKLLLLAAIVCPVPNPSGLAQEPPRHWHHAGALPPGAIGKLRLRRGGPLLGRFQSVQIRVPDGTRIALAMDGQFTDPVAKNVLTGMLVGAVYRLRITDTPIANGVEVYPTIELIDRTYPPPGLALRFPIPIELTAEELDMAAQGAFITRVIYVEDPSLALPVVQKPGQTEWFEATAGEDPLVVADRLGRPVAILRIGGRYPDDLQDDGHFTYGTPPIEIYDESMVPSAEDAQGGWPTYRLPCDELCRGKEKLPCKDCQPGDHCSGCTGRNLIGPPDEYLCDGGDYGLPVGIRADWDIEGLEQEDTIAHYDTLDHQVVVEPSNRVCIYAPRFAAVRRAVGPLLEKQFDAVNEFADKLTLVHTQETIEPAVSVQRYTAQVDIGQRPVSILRNRDQAGEVKQRVALLESVGLLAPYANLSIVRAGKLENREKPWLAIAVQSAHTWTGDQAAQVVVDNMEAVELAQDEHIGVVYGQLEPDRPQLRICKLASTGNALPGQIVEFTLRFDNVGDQVIGNVTIVDNLSTRLEYVKDSAKSSLQANFFTEPNEGGSSLLRWEIKKPVEPGEGGILQFQCTVR